MESDLISKGLVEIAPNIWQKQKPTILKPEPIKAIVQSMVVPVKQTNPTIKDVEKLTQFKHLTKIFLDLNLPLPITEHKFHPDRKWRFDYAWIDQRVALECEGGIWSKMGHSTGKGITRDVEKYNNATVLGWRIIRCTPQNIFSTEIITMVKQLLG